MDDQPAAWSLEALGPTIVAAAPDAVIVADRDGIVRLWNAGAERLFGHPAAEAIGRSLDLIIPEKQRAAHWAGWQRMLQTGTSRYGEDDLLAVPGLRRDGSRVSLEFSIFPVRDDRGEVTGLGAVLRDVTRRFEETKAMRRRLAEAEAALKQAGDGDR